MRDLWSIPLAPPEVVLPPVAIPAWDQIDPFPIRCQAEQYIWLAYLAKRGLPVDLRYRWQFSSRWAWLSEAAIANNYLVASAEQLGVKLAPRLELGVPEEAFYTHADWVDLYRIYCAGGGSIARQGRRQWRLHQMRAALVAAHCQGRARVRFGGIKRRLLGNAVVARKPVEREGG